MTKPRHIHRIPPCSQYEFAKTQAWIEDMYAKGWELEKDSYFFGTFEFIEREPRRIRCRMEATDTNGGLFSEERDPDMDQRTLYRELGWHWVGRRGQFHIYITDDPAAPELHTDPRVQAMNIRALTKFLRTGICNSIIEFLIYYFLLWQYDLSLGFVALGFWPSMFLTVSLVGSMLHKLWQCLKFYRLRKQMEQGIVPEQRRDYRKGRWLHNLSPLVSLTLWVCIIWMGGQRLATERVPIEEWTDPLPFATMQDVFADAAEVRDNDLHNFLGGSTVLYYHDWFTPAAIELNQYADVTLADGTTIWCDLNVDYYQTRYEWFANLLAKDHAGQVNGTFLDQLFGEKIEIIPLEGLDCDYAVSWQNVYPYILLRDGNQVIRVSYNHNVARHFTPEEFARLILDSIR